MLNMVNSQRPRLVVPVVTEAYVKPEHWETLVFPYQEAGSHGTPSSLDGFSQENPGLYNGGFGGTNGYHYFRKPPYIYN